MDEFDEIREEIDKRLKDTEYTLRKAYQETNRTIKRGMAQLEAARLANEIGKIVNPILDTNAWAIDYITGKLAGVYNISFEYTTSNIKRQLGIDYSAPGELSVDDLLTDYDKRAFAKLKTKSKVEDEVLKAVLKGIKAEEGIPQIAQRIAAITNAARSRTILIARTEYTRAQNNAALSAMRAADAYGGITLRKQWQATYDSRTRHSHRDVDGEVRDIDEKFSNGCAYPGDPDGGPAEVCNCRCTLLSVFPDEFVSDRERALDERLNEIKAEVW